MPRCKNGTCKNKKTGECEENMDLKKKQNKTPIVPIYFKKIEQLHKYAKQNNILYYNERPIENMYFIKKIELKNGPFLKEENHI